MALMPNTARGVFPPTIGRLGDLPGETAETMPGALGYWRVVHRSGVRLRDTPSPTPGPNAMVSHELNRR
jgi:hypothetical protein